MISTRTYAIGSILLAGFCMFRSWANTSNAAQAMAFLLSSKAYVLAMVNLAFLMLYGFGKLIQHLIFGELREIERKRLNDRLLKYILFKIVFVGSILEISNMIVFTIWAGWFSVLGFLKLFSLLSRDRFEYLTTYKPSTPLGVHMRIFGLLMGILLIDALWFAASASIFGPAGTSVVLLMTFECLTLFLSTIQTVVKYAIHGFDLYRRDEFWELRGTYTFYTEFITESLILVATIGHYMHILYLHGLSFTLIHVVLFLHMRLAFQGLRLKIASWSRYRQMNADLNTRYPNVSSEELDQYNDSCAICLTHLSASAKKLPCGHIFHTVCLRSWLERNHSCPTCRQPLSPPANVGTGTQAVGHAHAHGHGHVAHGPAVDMMGDVDMPLGDEFVLGGGGAVPDPAPAAMAATGAPAQPLFRVNAGGNGLLNWLPNFRVQVVHHPRQPMMMATAPEEWVRSVQEIFPHVAAEVISADLRRTRSVDATIDNILHNRLPVQQHQQRELVSSPPQPRSPGVQTPEAEDVRATTTEAQEVVEEEEDHPSLRRRTPQPPTSERHAD